MMNVQDALLSSKQQVQAVLSSASPGINDMTAYLREGMGKGVRTLLLLTAAANEDGKVPDDAPHAAAAIELLHMATLVHDDVIDDADTRRGLPSLHKKFDIKSAVICGDYLLSLSLSMIADMDRQRLYLQENSTLLAPRISRSLSAICRGEYIQHINIGNLDLDLPTYLRIISGKTAMLFVVSAYVGAVLGNESDETAQAIGRFGRCMGMAFQIIDDCKDYEWTESQAMKPVINDIRNGIITLPLILAMRKNPELRAIAAEIVKEHGDLAVFAKSLRDIGGADAAREIALRYVTWGDRALKDVSPKKRESLSFMLNNILK